MFNQPGMNSNGFMPMQPQYPQFGRQMPFNQFVPSTNKRFVRSLEEALSLPADFNSQNIYFDANENVMYDICTNGQGEKSWAIFAITPKQTSSKNTSFVAANDYEDRFKKLENKLEELINAQYNAKSTDATNASSAQSHDAGG